MIKEIEYIFTKKQKIRLVQLFIAILVNAFLELMGVTVILPFVNVIVSPNKMMNNSTISAICRVLNIIDANQLLLLCAITIIVIYLVKNAYSVFVMDVSSRFVLNNRKRLSCQIMRAYMEQPYTFHLLNNSSVLMSRINTDTAMFFAVVDAALQFLTEAIVCIVLVIFMLITDTTITLAIVTAMILFVAFYTFFFRKRFRRMGEDEQRCENQMSQRELQALQGIKEVKILNCEKYFVREYEYFFSQYADINRKKKVLSGLPRPLMEFVCISALMLAISHRVGSGMELAEFVSKVSVFIVSAVRLLPSFSRLSIQLNTILCNKIGVEHIYRNLKEKESFSNISTGIKRELAPEKGLLHSEIVIQNMTFQYPNTDKKVLENVNLVIPAKKSVALIGPSGQGKTTLADLLLGILTPVGGRIIVDGIDIRENITEWYSHVGYVAQNIYMIDDTIEKNIAFGVDESDIDSELVWQALEDVQMKQFVESLPKGIKTIVGEGGARLSGGQRQRLGIARALYHNPKLLILDEATSALDTDTEKAVMDAINALAGKKTLVIIAHRLSTIKKCDIVYEVNRGKVIEKKEK